MNTPKVIGGTLARQVYATGGLADRLRERRRVRRLNTADRTKGTGRPVLNADGTRTYHLHTPRVEAAPVPRRDVATIIELPRDAAAYAASPRGDHPRRELPCYRGAILADGRSEVFRETEPLTMHVDIIDWLPRVWGWGDWSASVCCRRLATDLLVDALGDVERAARLERDYAHRVIRHLPESWSMTIEEVRTYARIAEAGQWCSCATPDCPGCQTLPELGLTVSCTCGCHEGVTQ